MAHKHHQKEARTRAVQQHDGGCPASDICKDMNITPGILKLWGKAKGSGRTLIYAHLNSALLPSFRCARQKVRPDPVFGRRKERCGFP